LAKLVVGYATGALSLVADGYDSLFDAAGNVIGLVGIYIAARPADPDHPYGHRKFETAAAVSISILLFLTTWELVQSAIERLRDPASVALEVNVWTFGALLLSIALHVAVSVYEYRAGKQLNSDVLIADAKHTRADIYISCAVIAGMIAVRFGYPIVDPLLALGIAALILKLGIEIIRDSSKVLLDGAIVPVSEIERIVMGVRDVRACHEVRSRGHEDAVYVDLHIKVAPEMSTAQSHAIAHDVQHRLRSEIPVIQDVVVHVEPEDEGAKGSAAVIPTLRELAQEQGLAIHDIAARSVEGEICLEAHVTLDGTLTLGEAHERVSRLEEASKARIVDLGEMVTHIEPAGEDREEVSPGLSQEAVQSAVKATLRGMDLCGAYHKLRVNPEGENWSVSLHWLLDPGISLSQAHAVSSEIEGQLRDHVPRLSQVIVHMEPLAEGESQQTRSL
jgi:cation diffusion facilitator family transporter